MDETQVRSDEELAEGAEDSVGGAEDPGLLRLKDTLAEAGSLFDRRRVARETVQLASEVLKILAGTSHIEIDPKDRRFKDPTWQEHPLYHRLGQAYMAYCRAVENSVNADADWRNRTRAELLVDVLTSSLAPTNTLLGNPEALKRAFETGGRSLARGLRHFISDLRHNGGMPSQMEPSRWKLGKDLGATPGAVVFRNDVLEIIQYQPQTARVYRRPVLLMTPQINKYYFLDMAPGRSLVEYAVSNGIQVFMVSWRNPGPEHADWNLDTYCEALIEATDAVCDIAGTDDLNTFGFCAGGITMSALLAHLTDIGDSRIHSASYSVTLLDFSVPTLIGTAQSRPLLEKVKRRSLRKGVIEGRDLRNVFSWLRPNDLVWSFWVNNYLMGKAPPAFDILAWNADCTNLPAGLHVDFLDLFQDNTFCRAGAWKVLGSPVDLSKVKVDNFVAGAINDHLTPWKACYQTTQLLGGASTFVLSHAGHIASIVNPPGNPKASYWTGGEPGSDPDVWLDAAQKRQGTWWEYWLEWIQPRSGDQHAARKRLGSKKHPPQEAAPGTYVFERPKGAR